MDWREEGLRLIDLQAKRERIYAEYHQKMEVLTYRGPDLPREEIAQVCGFVCQRLEDLYDVNAQIDEITEEFKRGKS